MWAEIQGSSQENAPCSLSPLEREWERIPCDIPTKTLPRETASLAATIQPLEKPAMDRPLETIEGAAIL